MTQLALSMCSYEGGCGLASVMKTGCGLAWKARRLASCGIVHYSSYIKDSLVKWTWTVWKAGLFQVSSRPCCYIHNWSWVPLDMVNIPRIAYIPPPTAAEFLSKWLFVTVTFYLLSFWYNAPRSHTVWASNSGRWKLTETKTTETKTEMEKVVKPNILWHKVNRIIRLVYCYNCRNPGCQRQGACMVWKEFQHLVHSY